MDLCQAEDGGNCQDTEGQEREVTKGEAGGGVCGAAVVGAGMFPGIDEEAVQAAECGKEERRRKQDEAQVGAAGDSGDEDGGAKEDADGDLLGQTMGYLLRADGAGGGVNEDEVAGEKASKDEVEMQCGGFEAGKESGQGEGGEENSGEEGGSVVVVKVVAGFEVFGGVDLKLNEMNIHQTGVHQAIGGVEHPDGDGHGEDGRGGEMDVIYTGDEPGPEGGDGGGIQGEKMPKDKRGVGRLGIEVGARPGLRGRGLNWGRGGHLFILGLVVEVRRRLRLAILCGFVLRRLPSGRDRCRGRRYRGVRSRRGGFAGWG